MKRTLLSLAFLSLALIAAPAAGANLTVENVDASRSDVREWCAVEGGVLSDREDYTLCIVAEIPGTAFACDDAGICTRTGFDGIATGTVGNPLPDYLPEAVREGAQKIVPSPHYPVPYGARTKFD